MTLSEQTSYLQTFINSNISKVNHIEKIYQELIDCITEHNHRYYLQNAPIISDFEFDQLFDLLKKIEQNYPQLISSNSPTQSLIWQVSDWFKKAQHKTPLLSLENSYNTKDLQEFDDKILKILTKEWIFNYFYTIEPKYDWLSVELIYENWNLKQAITRWDWYNWDDITINVKTINNIPLRISQDIKNLRVRWEIMMPKSVLKEINKQREMEWQYPFSNTRNAAAWSIKLLDSNEVRKRKLVCFVYDLLEATNINNEKIEPNLKDLWFSQVNLNFWKQNISWIQEICTNPQTKQKLEQLDFDFDWLVIKLQDSIFEENKIQLDKSQTIFKDLEPSNSSQNISLRSIIWSTQHHPKRAIAYKFPAQQASTQITSIDFQIWRTGIITPVANLQPVQLSGVEISRVSLHNFDFINEKDIKLYDYIRIQRSWEVIPYITWVIKERRTWIEEPITAPLFCPECNAPIINIKLHYYCTNPECKSQLKEKLIHFCSKEAMDIQWIWDSIIDILVQQNLIKTVADIYKIWDIQTQIFLKKIPWFWEKKLFEISKQLNESKTKELRRIINALWIPHIWKKTAQDIASVLESIWTNKLEDIIRILTNNELMNQINGVWEKTIIALKEFFENQQVIEMLNKLQEFWINFSTKNKPSLFWSQQKEYVLLTDIWNNLHKANISNTGQAKWLWNSFSITWSFPFSRELIKTTMEQNWFIFHEQPKKDTNFILCGEKAWNKKEKAESIWIRIYNTREEILWTFPFLWNIIEEEKIKKTKKTNNQISLF